MTKSRTTEPAGKKSFKPTPPVSKFSSTDNKRLLDIFCDLSRIESLSLSEKAVADHIKKMLKGLGYKVREDKAAKALGGNQNNLYISCSSGKNSSGTTRKAKTAGSSNVIAGSSTGGTISSREKSPLILSAHIDTVGPAKGTVPVVKGGYVTSKGDTTLGADDKSGVAIILEILHRIKEDKTAEYDLEVVITVAEEIGLKGAFQVDKKMLKGKRAIFFDSEGPAGTITVGSPYYNAFICTITGKAAHAGVNPDKGINAIYVMSEIIAGLKIGRIDKVTTMNVGRISSTGSADNIVPDNAVFRGEIRSHDLKKLNEVTAKLKARVAEVAKKHKAKSKVTIARHFDGYLHKPSDPFLSEVVSVMRSYKVKPNLVVSGGGSDANIFSKMGISSLNLATGAENVHTVEERLNLNDFYRSADIAYELIKKL